MGESFQAMGIAEHRHSAASPDGNATLLQAWAHSYPSIQPPSQPVVAMLTAAIAPWIAPLDALPIMQLSYWLSSLDELTAERQLTLDELRQRSLIWHTGALTGTLNGYLLGEHDELTPMLLDIRSALAHHPLFGALREEWAYEVRRLAEALVEKHQAARDYQTGGTATLPSMESYLSYATYSSGVPLWAMTVWIVAQDASILEQLDLIHAATRQASKAVRLYSDLIALEREQPGNYPNAVLIAQRVVNTHALSEAQQVVRQLADSYGQACLVLADRIHTTSGKIEGTLRRRVEFHANFYHTHAG